MEQKQEKEKKKKKRSKGLRIFGKILLGLFIFIFLVLLFVRSPWGQNIIKNQVISSISDQTNTRIEVDRLFITFSGNIYLDGLYLEDEEGDTLVYSDKLEAGVPLWPIIRGKGIAIDFVEWSGVRANITRQDSIEGFNFSFLTEAFAPADTTATEPAPQDTTATTEFRLGDINLSDFDIVYNDAVLGIESRYRVGTLELEMEETDLENMRFHASEASITNTIIDYRQTPVPENPNPEEAPMPVLKIDELQLENVAANYESVPAGMVALVDIQDFIVELPLADLAENNIEINRLQLNQSDFFLKTTSSPEEGQPSTEEITEEETEGFQWPDWRIRVGEISLNENTITYVVDNAQPEEETFNPDAMLFRNLAFEGSNIYLRNEEAGANLENISFTESSGINLKEFQLNASIDDSAFNLQDLVVRLNNNYLEGNMNVTYDSIDELMNTPENSVVEVNLPEFRFSLEDIFLIQPDLRSNEYMLALSKKPLYGEMRAEGTLASLEISPVNINWGETTSLAARGSIQNPTDPESLQFNFPRIRMVSRRGDIRRFVDEEQMNISLPEKFTLVASINGNPEDIEAVANLDSSEGQIDLDAGFSSSAGIAFDADLEVSNLALGNILNNEQLGDLNLTLTASGSGETINSLDATMETVISSFHYNEYAIENLRIIGELVDGRGPVTMDYKDDNLNADLESFVILDSVAPQVNIALNVEGAKLQALGLAQKDIRVALELDGSFRGNAESYDVNAEITDGVAVYNDDSYLLGDFGLSARVRPDSTAVDIDNQIIQLNLRSNTDPASFAGALQRHFQSYLTDDVEIDTVENPVNLQLRTEIRDNPLLREVFLTGLEEMDTIAVAVDFSERSRELSTEIELPYVVYQGNEIDSLEFHMDTNREDFDFQLGFHAVNAGPLNIRETAVGGEVVDPVLHLDFNSYYEDEHLMHIQSEISRSNDSIIFNLDPSELILNAGVWEVPDSNEIRIAEGNTTFTDFILTRNNQQVEITDDYPDMARDHVAITFDNFRLASILSYLNPEENLASGGLNGNLIFEDVNGGTGLLAGLEILDLNVMEVPMGHLTMNAESTGGGSYDFEMAIKEGNVDLDLTGGFDATEEGAQWDTQLLLNEVQMVVVEAFSQEEITETSGSFSGDFSLSGTTAEPVYEGNLHFSEAGFTVSTLNAPFVLPDETLRIDNQGIYFESFDLQDQNNNNLTLNGEVLTENLLNPSFNVKFEANDFMLLNSTSEDNDLYYGTVIFDADGSLTGNLNVPEVDLTLVIDSRTDVTYVIPPSEIGIEERDGVVIFVNREAPESIMSQTEEETFTMSGFLMNSVISINEDVVFNVIIDEQTGDNLQITGSGDLNFNMYANGRTTLTGRYEMSGGHYEMNLYGLVNRRFEIVEGSTITWAGDPFDANLDVTATYRVETSASSLMATQTAGAEASVRNRFRQELPFIVYLNVDGELLEPVLTFGLDMPENEQGAIGGQVYGRIQQLNQQEQELNRQVFSLLVLNRFYPEGTSDGSGGGTMAIARDNLNNALSDQLNMLSNDLLGDSGIALDFNLDSFTDYQGDSPQERTQLDIAARKSFLDERLVVSVGSEVDIQGSNQEPGATTPLIGNVNIEYLLTENGRWRLRGFRRNSFENVIEGQVIVSGIAFIFTREFNEFRELWGSLNEEEDQDEAENEEESGQ